ncbi:MAG: VCBS domain-containing protein, partial [Hyphomicrobium sp.]
MAERSRSMIVAVTSSSSLKSSAARSWTMTLTTGGIVRAEEGVRFTVRFDQLVSGFQGTTLILNNGGVATLDGSLNKDVMYLYTAQTGDDVADLAVVSLALNGQTITDATGIVADLSGANLNPSGIITVDTTSPSTANDLYTVAEDGVLNVPAPGIMSNDAQGAILQGLITQVRVGSNAVYGGGAFRYQPGANFNGFEFFTYVALMPDGGFGPIQKVTILVTPSNDEQTAPSTNSVNTLEGAASAAIAIGATDVDGDALTYAVKPGSDPQKGSVSFNAAAATFVYTPTANANGADTFTILIDDGQGTVSEQVVSVTISAANDAAVVAGERSGTVTEDSGVGQIATGLLAVTDVDGAAEATFLPGTIAGTYGSLVLAADGAWTYTLNNALAAVQALNAGQTLPDVVTVQSADGTTSTISLTINGTNDSTVITNGNGGGTRRAPLVFDATDPA